ncbi:histidine phosphatase family protein [Carnobacterium gallinarum]|uniref:histidine phosphatase family protein n=1 Tax=Carnobacterium gallinarum TaxID=2749 RepID=UPI0005539DA7|nr:histidine phosphatase family protein [Carnobacterium gallinarum]
MSKVETLPTTIYLARHGQTWFNKMERVQGWSDTPLTPEGVAGVEKLGRGLKEYEFVIAYSSDAGRARETAQIVLAHNQHSTDLVLQESKEIREACFGIFEGDTNERMWQHMAESLGHDTIEAMMTATTPESIQAGMKAIVNADTLGIAEDFLTVQKRVTKALIQIAKEVQLLGGGNILIVSHGMTIAALLSGLVEGLIKTDIQNATITKLTYQAGALSVEKVGSTDYWV